MKEKLLFVYNIALMTLVSIILASLQTTLWYELFGRFPAPLFWLPQIMYFCLYRPQWEGILSVYWLCLILASLSIVPLGLLMLDCLLLFIAAQSLKSRIFWNGPQYFILVCFFACLGFHLIHLANSWIFEANPISRPAIGAWIMSGILTPLVASPIYWILTQIDKVSFREHLIETAETF